MTKKYYLKALRPLLDLRHAPPPLLAIVNGDSIEEFVKYVFDSRGMWLVISSELSDGQIEQFTDYSPDELTFHKLDDYGEYLWGLADGQPLLPVPCTANELLAQAGRDRLDIIARIQIVGPENKRLMAEWMATLKIQNPDAAELAEIVLKAGAYPETMTAEALAPMSSQAQSQPSPLTTNDIAFNFAGLYWDEKKWKRNLGNKPLWLDGCVAIPGKQGGNATRWNPVSIGAALINKGHTQARSVRAAFQKKELLKPWLDAWKTYEAEYLDT
jgi:hypothetical protein